LDEPPSPDTAVPCVRYLCTRNPKHIAKPSFRTHSLRTVPTKSFSLNCDCWSFGVAHFTEVFAASVGRYNDGGKYFQFWNTGHAKLRFSGFSRHGHPGREHSGGLGFFRIRYECKHYVYRGNWFRQCW